MKFFILTLIRLYQKTFSPDHGIVSWFRRGPTCCFQPTCSEYMYASVERYGITRGIYLGTRRLLRCHPFKKNITFDPLP